MGFALAATTSVKTLQSGIKHLALRAFRLFVFWGLGPGQHPMIPNAQGKDSQQKQPGYGTQYHGASSPITSEKERNPSASRALSSHWRRINWYKSSGECTIWPPSRVQGDNRYSATEPMSCPVMLPRGMRKNTPLS